MVCNRNPFVSPFNSLLYNIGDGRHTIHIAHFRMTVKFHSLYWTVVCPLAGKILIFFDSPHRANRQFPVKTVNGSHPPKTNKTAGLGSFFDLLQRCLICKHFYSDGICKICHMKDKNGFSAAKETAVPV